MIRYGTALLALFGIASAATAQGGAWRPRPELLNSNGPIYALHVYAGELYAGGDFTRIGGVDAVGVARFDGTSWRALEEPLGLVDGIGESRSAWVEAFAEFQGDLVIGGRFNRVGSRAIHFVGRWDGETIRGVGNGTNGKISSLAVYRNRLIVGGLFTEADGVPANRVAQFNGTFAAMDNGFAAGVLALASHDDVLWAGGLFSTTGSRSAPRIAQWAHGAWVGMPPGFQTNEVDLAPAVMSIVIVEDELYALGQFQSFQSTRMNSIARWDGTTWVPFEGGGLGTNGERYWATSMVKYGESIYFGGQMGRAGGKIVNNIARYDGQDWWPLGLGTNAEVKSLAVYQGELYAAGVFTRANGVLAHHLAVWKEASVTPPARSSMIMGVYPNPVVESATIAIETREAGTVELLLSDLRGRVLQRWSIVAGASGFEQPFPLVDGQGDRLASGRYVLTARAGGEEVSRSVILRR